MFDLVCSVLFFFNLGELLIKVQPIQDLSTVFQDFTFLAFPLFTLLSCFLF